MTEPEARKRCVGEKERRSTPESELTTRFFTCQKLSRPDSLAKNSLHGIFCQRMHVLAEKGSGQHENENALVVQLDFGCLPFRALRRRKSSISSQRMTLCTGFMLPWQHGHSFGSPPPILIASRHSQALPRSRVSRKWTGKRIPGFPRHHTTPVGIESKSYGMPPVFQ